MKYGYRELVGKCKTCLGCNRLEDINFKGVYRCEYATEKQLDIEDLEKELKKNGNWRFNALYVELVW